MKKTYRIFISHSWSYSDYYDRLIELLEEQGLSYYNHSVPKNNPIHTKGTNKELESAIAAKLKGTSCVLVMAGVYSGYSKWITKEMKLANKKPIIAIEPWAAERTSLFIKENADKVVKWQGKSIVDAIKELG